MEYRKASPKNDAEKVQYAGRGDRARITQRARRPRSRPDWRPNQSNKAAIAGAMIEIAATTEVVRLRGP